MASNTHVTFTLDRAVWWEIRRGRGVELREKGKGNKLPAPLKER